MCGLRLPCLSRRLFLALLLLGPVMPWVFAQETPSSPSSSESSPTLSPEPTSSTSELMRLWNEYDQQFKSSMLTLEQFLDQVEAFGISFESLPGFMTHLADSLKASEEARLSERKIAADALDLAVRKGADAEKRADFWKYTTFAASGVALAGWIAFVIAMGL